MNTNVGTHAVAPEDLARADYYAVLSRLFYAPPDAALLASLAAAGEVANEVSQQGALPDAWNDLCATAAQTSVEAAQEEYAALFIGIGKPQVVLYASWHLTGFMMEKPLAKLRDDLAELGLSRIGEVPEPEDHFAALMDAMRHLLTDQCRAEAQRHALQRGFFQRISRLGMKACAMQLTLSRGPVFIAVQQVLRVISSKLKNIALVVFMPHKLWQNK